MDSNFQYLWEQTENGVYAALLRQVESGRDVSVEDAQRAYCAEAARWTDSMRPQHSFLVMLDRSDPAARKRFTETLDAFVFQPEDRPGALSPVPYILADAGLAALGAGLGWLLSGVSLVSKYLGTTVAVICGGVIFGALFAGVLRTAWVAKAQDSRKAVLEGYAHQLHSLGMALEKIVGH